MGPYITNNCIKGAGRTALLDPYIISRNRTHLIKQNDQLVQPHEYHKFIDDTEKLQVNFANIELVLCTKKLQK